MYDYVLQPAETLVFKTTRFINVCGYVLITDGQIVKAEPCCFRRNVEILLGFQIFALEYSVAAHVILTRAASAQRRHQHRSVHHSLPRLYTGCQGSAFAVLFTNATCKNVTFTFMITFIYSLRGARTSRYKNSLFVNVLQNTVNEL